MPGDLPRPRTAAPPRSAAVREGARQVMAWLHGWCGMLLGWVLYLMCLGGTLSVFRPEIGRWMRPGVAAATDPDRAAADAVAWLGAHAARAPGWYMQLPTARSPLVDAQWWDAAGGGYVYRAFDPATGAPAARTTLGGQFFYRLHFELELPWWIGRHIAWIAAAVMLVAIVSGVIAHRRFFRDFFTFRPAKGQRSWLDAHNAMGVLALPFHVMITFTGLVTLASMALPWGIAANYGRDSARFFRDFAPGAIERPAAGRPAPLAPVAPILADARARTRAPLGMLYVVNPGDAGAIVQVLVSDETGLAHEPRTLSYDGVTGRLLADAAETRPLKRTYDVLYGLHLARFAPALLRWLYALGGALLTAAIASGLVLWIVKRREKAPLGLGNRLVERANVGVIAGLPVAAMAFFWANRLLPLDLAARADAEVHVALWTAATCLALGLALPPRRGWPLLLGLAAVACAGAPLVGLAVGIDGPALAAPGLTVLRVGDALMLACGLGFAIAARRAARA